MIKMTNLKSMIIGLDKLEKNGTEYYSVIDLKHCLDDIYTLEISQDIILIPFYLTSGGTYEIYDYELNICIVKQSNKIKYFMTKTGKTSLEEIDKEILEKLNLCYIEIMEKGNPETTIQMKRYIEYLLNSPKVRDRIPKELGQLKKEKLFFEVYFC
ncbi:MAG: hypothetical protein NC543_09155 [bacterium]|nr:hypothetical protein [bacterium]MCM1375735.1 hypothetical protein [Muribaculum sp.]